MKKDRLWTYAALILISFLGFMGYVWFGVPSMASLPYLFLILFLVLVYTMDRKEIDQVRDMFETFLLVLGIDLFARYILAPVQLWNPIVSYLFAGASFFGIQWIVSKYLPWTTNTSEKIMLIVQIITWIIMILVVGMFFTPFISRLNTASGVGEVLAAQYLDYAFTLILSYIISSRLIQGIHFFMEDLRRLLIIGILVASLFFYTVIKAVLDGMELTKAIMGGLMITTVFLIFSFLAGSFLEFGPLIKRTVRRGPGTKIVRETVTFGKRK